MTHSLLTRKIEPTKHLQFIPIPAKAHPMEHEKHPENPDAGPPKTHGGVVLAPSVRVPAGEITVSFVRSSGPGGQNVNKRSTKAQLRIVVDRIPLPDRAAARLRRLARGSINSEGELLIESDETRSQSRNRRACMDRLRELVMRAMIEPKQRRKTKPTCGSIRRRLEDKKQQAQKKQRRRPPDPS